MIRYKLTEMTDSGYGRRIYTDRLNVAYDFANAMGGKWRVQRQSRPRWSDRWRLDGGINPSFVVEALR